MRRTGTADRLTAILSAAGVAAVLFDEVEPDPSADTVDRAVRILQGEQCDLVIGLGGGSPMDAARAIAGAATLDEPIIEYVRGRAIDRPGLPLINIATTSGTASEITAVAVIRDEERHLKVGVKSPHWYARVAITDPELTVTMPPALTAATGIDALTHATESYLSTGATPPSEALALRAVELIGASLRAAVADGSDRSAREGMSMGSMVAGMAFANSGLGLVHGLAHPLGARLGVAHGVACGRLLPHVMRHNFPSIEAKLPALARALTGSPTAAAEETIAAIESLIRDVGVRPGIADLDVSDDQMPTLASEGLLGGAVKTNPHPVDEEGAYAVLSEARDV
jgi:alcohol dehydrogenase